MFQKSHNNKKTKFCAQYAGKFSEPYLYYLYAEDIQNFTEF